MSMPRRRTARDPERGNGHLSDERSSLLPNGHSRGKRRLKNAWETTYSFLGLNYCNVLLPIVPVALIVGYLELNPTVTFVLNFIAIIPLASLLSDATEELAEHVGHTLGGLLNATFGNATELIVRSLKSTTTPPFLT